MWTVRRALLLAAQSRGVEKIVYCSSVAALGLTGTTEPADESTPVDPAKIVSVYKQSKYRAEQGGAGAGAGAWGCRR